MPSPLIPYQRYQKRFLSDRIEQGGTEIRSRSGNRPWVILSNESHQHNLCFCVPSTRGLREDSSNEYMVLIEQRQKTARSDQYLGREGEGSRADVQQLWTFPIDPRRDVHVGGVPVVPEERAKATVERLSEHIRNSAETYGSTWTYAAGNVLWVRLRAHQKVERTDLLPIHVEYKRKTGIDWPYEDRRLPCLVIANHRSCAHQTPAYPLITVVPLIEAPRFRESYPDNPTVTSPQRDINGNSIRLSALTQLYLTLDYTREPRVVFDRRGRNLWWMADHEEYQNVVAEVLGLLGADL